jgi:hypothetical protein
MKNVSGVSIKLDLLIHIIVFLYFPCIETILEDLGSGVMVLCGSQWLAIEINSFFLNYFTLVTHGTMVFVCSFLEF